MYRSTSQQSNLTNFLHQPRQLGRARQGTTSSTMGSTGTGSGSQTPQTDESPTGTMKKFNYFRKNGISALMGSSSSSQQQQPPPQPQNNHPHHHHQDHDITDRRSPSPSEDSSSNNDTLDIKSTVPPDPAIVDRMLEQMMVCARFQN